MNKIAVLGMGGLLSVVVLLGPTRVRGDLYFTDGDRYVVDYPIAGSVYVENDTELTLRAGGSVGSDLYLDWLGLPWSTSTLILDGGFIGGTLRTESHSQVIMKSGSVAHVWTDEDSRMDVYGGQVNSGSFYVETASLVTVYGRNFQGNVYDTLFGLDGPYDLYERWSPGWPFIAGDYARIQGILASGESFNWIFGFQEGRVNLQVVPLPGAVLLGAIGLIAGGWRLRRRTV